MTPEARLREAAEKAAELALKTFREDGLLDLADHFEDFAKSALEAARRDALEEAAEIAAAEQRDPHPSEVGLSIEALHAAENCAERIEQGIRALASRAAGEEKSHE